MECNLVISYNCVRGDESDVYLYNYSCHRGGKSFKIYDIVFEFNEYKDAMNNLKERKIINYDYDVKMYISSDNLVKLRKNVNDYNGYIVFE